MARATNITSVTLGVRAVTVVPGPLETFEHVGNDYGAPIEVSFDSNDWNMLYPGESVDSVGVADRVFVRNPNVAGPAIFFIRTGSHVINRRDVIGVSRDGRHPIGAFFEATTTAPQRMSTNVVPAPVAAIRRPHLKGFSLFNRGGAVAYVRFIWTQSLIAPVVGVTTQYLQFELPTVKEKVVDFTHGIGNPFPLTLTPNNPEYLWVWVTAGAGELDNTAPAGSIQGIINIC